MVRGNASSPAGGPNGLAAAADGTLYVAQNGGIWAATQKAEPGVQRIRDGVVDYVVTGLDAPNDLVFGPDGRLCVTDSRSGLQWGNRSRDLPGFLWAIQLETGEAELVIDDGPVFINGLGFDSDGHRLMVTATVSAELISYRLDQQPLVPTVAHTFPDGRPDGMAIGRHREWWVALTAADRVDVISARGGRIAVIDLPPGSLPTNVCFDDAHEYLFGTAAHAQSLLRIRVDDVSRKPTQ